MGPGRVGCGARSVQCGAAADVSAMRLFPLSGWIASVLTSPLHADADMDRYIRANKVEQGNTR